MFYYKLLSDIDRAFNPETGEYDLYAVEWEHESGWREWEKFQTEEERDEAIRLNDEYNDQPEVAAYINKIQLEESLWHCDYDIDLHLEYAAENSETVNVTNFLRTQYIPFENRDIIVKYIVDKFNAFNKQIRKARFAPKPATCTLADFVQI